jgi:hypothetical protein
MSRLIILSAEGDLFECSPSLASISQTIRDNDLEEEIDLGILEIDSSSLQLILNYCEHHQYTEPAPLQRTVSNNDFSSYVADPWDVEYINSLDTERLLRLVKAANKLAIRPIVELVSIKVASVFAGKTEEELQDLISMDVAVDRDMEDWLKQEYSWAIQEAGSEQSQSYLEERA